MQVNRLEVGFRFMVDRIIAIPRMLSFELRFHWLGHCTEGGQVSNCPSACSLILQILSIL